MRFIKPMIFATCLLQPLQVFASTDSFLGPKRQCSVVNGVIECVSQLKISPEERGQSLYNQTEKHGPLLGYGSPGYKDVNPVSQSLSPILKAVKIVAKFVLNTLKQLTQETNACWCSINRWI